MQATPRGRELDRGDSLRRLREGKYGSPTATILSQALKNRRKGNELAGNQQPHERVARTALRVSPLLNCLSPWRTLQYPVRMRAISAAVIATLATAALLLAQKQPPPFTFNKADTKLLGECDALDQQFEKRALVYHDPALEKYLAGLARPLLPSDALEHVKWDFRILRDPTVNAFGVPNGSIYINTGLFARAENDDQVIGRLAQEIAHVTNRHGYLSNRTLRKKSVATETIGTSSVFLGGIVAPYLVASAAGNPSEMGILGAITEYPRAFEQEADEIAVQRLKQVGRDPAQLVRLSLLIDDKLEAEPVSFWRDLPKTKDRMVYQKALVGLDKDPGAGSDGGYLDRMKTLILQNIQLALDTRRFRSAVAGAQRLAAAYPNDANCVFWLGESYRLLGPRQERLTEKELTPDGLRASYRKTAQRTEQDEANWLASTPEGKAALEANQEKSEELLHKAATIDLTLPDPYFGLGSLYEQQGKKDQAIAAYRKYIDLSQQPADKERAMRRVERLMKSSPGGMQ
jgi:beta-barrel assembly-enhancing protease